MRIAIISVHGCPLLAPGSREAGGMNVYLGKLGQELADRGVEVDIFTRWHEPDEPQVVTQGPHLRVIHLEAGGRGLRPKEELYFHLPEFLHNLMAFQQQENLHYDLIYAHYWLSGWIGVFLKHRWRAPLVAMFHTLGAVKNQVRAGEHESDLRIRTEQKIISKADAVVVATTQEQQQMMRLYRVQQQQVHIIPGGVDLELFHPIDRRLARRELGLNGEKILLFVGRPDPLKGLDILLSAASLLEHPAGVRVLVVGGDEEYVAVGRSPDYNAAALPQRGGVSFRGSVAHQLLPYFYNAADVCVVPSYYESFGMVAVEAMACGTPVVAARVGGLQSTIRDGETGFLIPWHCPEPFAERLELLLGNETLCVSLGEAARTAAQSYSWTAVTDRTLELYQLLTQS